MDSSGSSSPWCLWKLAVFLFETSLTFEVIITIFFWAVLFPDQDTAFDPFDFIDHIAPFLILVIEYSMNRIPFSMRHMPLSLALLLVYGIVNMCYSLVTGDPVYPVLTWLDVESYVIAVILLAFEAFLYWLFVKLTDFKIHGKKKDSRDVNDRL